MTNQERRQANRIIRNAKEMERNVFELVAILQEGNYADNDQFPWDDVGPKLHTIQSYWQVVMDLLINTQKEVAR